MRLPQQESDPRAEVAPFEFPPFGMVSASVWVNPNRRGIPEAQRRSTTVRWTDETGQERASTWDAGGEGGGWYASSGRHPPALVCWALIQLGVPLPPLRGGQQVDLTHIEDSVPYSYQSRGALDMGLVSYLSGSPLDTSGD